MNISIMEIIHYKKWEFIKNKIKKVSKQYSIKQVNDRQVYEEVAENLFFDDPNFDPNIKQTIQEKAFRNPNFKIMVTLLEQKI